MMWKGHLEMNLSKKQTVTGKWRGAYPMLNGRSATILHEYADGNGGITYTVSSFAPTPIICTGEFVMIGGEHQLCLTETTNTSSAARVLLEPVT
jgi:hypothetical protein